MTAELQKEIDPTDLVFYTLICTKKLTTAILVDCNDNIFKLSTPVAAQVDSNHIDIRIPSALQRTVTPILNMGIRLLVQLTYCRGGPPYCSTEPQ